MSDEKKKKSTDLTVENFYEKIQEKTDPNEKNPGFKIHGIKIPFRILIVGASGSMKTNAALDLCKKFSDTFEHITIVTRNVKEPLYKYMTEKIPEEQLTIIEIEEDDLSALPKMGELDDQAPPTLLIFDDLVLVKKQEPIIEYFIRCRKYNISVLYLTQSYFTTPKTVRGNCNSIILKKINSQNDLRMILTEYSLSVDLPQLIKMHQECTKDQKDWLMIRMDNPSGDQFYHNYTKIDTRGTNEKSENSQIPPPKTKSRPIFKQAIQFIPSNAMRKPKEIVPIDEKSDTDRGSDSEKTVDYDTSNSESEQGRKKRRRFNDIRKILSDPRFSFKK
jgi:hypothetical protein